MTSASLTLALITAACGTRVDAPGDTAVDTRTAEQEMEPGNILAEERIKSAGEQ